MAAPAVTGDVLANIRDISPLKSGMRAKGHREPVHEPMSKEYLQALAGSNIEFPCLEGLSKSFLPADLTKLHSKPFDHSLQAAHRRQFESNKFEGERNKRINAIDQITRSFPEDAVGAEANIGTPYMRHSMVDQDKRNVYVGQSFMANNAAAKHIKGVHRGSMGITFLNHVNPEDRGVNTLLANPEKQMVEDDAFYGAERQPGQRVTIFKAQGKKNKMRDTKTSIDFSIPVKAAGTNDWKEKYRTPEHVYNAPLELHMDQPAIKEACSKQTMNLRHATTPESKTKPVYNNRNGVRRPAKWGDYTL